MRIIYITAGAGRMYCGSCLRDGALASELLKQGNDVLFVPLYTPLRTEGEDVTVDELFYGGINVYLEQKFSLFRHTPRFVDHLFENKSLLLFVARFGHLTAAEDLAEMAISVLEGEEGRQRKELERLVAWLQTQPAPDVVLLPNSLLAGLAGPICERLKRPVLCLLSGENFFIDEFPEPYRSLAREELQRHAAVMNGFIAPNRFYAEFMADYLGVAREKCHVVPLGIDCSGYPREQPQPPGIFTIGYLARILPPKGLHVLAEAFRILKSDPETSSCRLRVAGYLGPEYRPYFDAIRAEIRRWGLEDSFEHAGELDREGKIRFLSSLSVLSVPAVHPESKGQFVPEALAAGTPVVLPRVGCFPEWIEATGGGLLVEPNNPNSLAEGLARLMKDAPLARGMGRAGHEAVHANFTIARMASALIESLGRISESSRLDPAGQFR